jgi:hypothetical protein
MTRSIAGALLTLLTAMVTTQPTSQPNSQPTDRVMDEPLLDADAEATRQNTMREFAAAKPASPIALDELVECRVVDQFLDLHFRQKQTHMELVAVPLKGWPGYALSRSFTLNIGIDTFEISHWSFAQPDVMRHTQMLSTVNNLQIAIDESSRTHRLSVSLVQNVRDPVVSDIQSEVSFRVRKVSLDADQNEFVMDQIDVRAESFDALAREHSQSLRTYLGDVFARLGQPMLLRGGEARAKQILQHDPHQVETVAKEVARLVELLDSADEHQRMQARQQLHDMGAPAQQAMLRLSVDQLSAEQQQTIEELTLGAGQTTEDQIKLLGNDVDYLLDVMNTRDPLLRRLAGERLRNHGIDIPHDSDSATRFEHVARVRQTRASTTQPSR